MKIVKAILHVVDLNRSLKTIEIGCVRGKNEKVDAVADLLVKYRHQKSMLFIVNDYEYLQSSRGR